MILINFKMNLINNLCNKIIIMIKNKKKINIIINMIIFMIIKIQMIIF